MALGAAGTDVAIEAADIALMADDMRRSPMRSCCPIAPFETLDEVSEIYQVDSGQLLQELQDAAQGTEAHF